MKKRTTNSIGNLVINLPFFLLLILGIALIFNNQIKSVLLINQSQKYNLVNYSEKKLKDNWSKEGNFDFDSVEPVSNERVLKAQFKNLELPVIAGISIPSINLSLPVFKGLDNSALLSGAGTMKPEQRLGEGNYALASHSVQNKTLLFSPLEFISVQQKIYLTDLKNIYTYKVNFKEKVDPTRVEFIDNIPQKKLLTLITCGDDEAKTRLIVQGELTDITNFNSTDKQTRSLFM
ncbi:MULTISPECIES: class A sortase [Enterococcus]|uniref:Class A sortase n=1 Tax=Enterococcus dongliensis TaxID=2559925 RepID=A0ABU3ES88_9ENTE|nr:class A sortase [Enterococcus dongliensis]MDT2597730.1 class A sortase [Enterococcus dongliensis]MDT2635817.1 class A sortase [Enterococcus dongliensis]